MDAVTTEIATNLLKKAQMISSSKYGHFVDFEHESPLGKNEITLPTNCKLFKSKHAFGELLFIRENDEIETVAFIFDHSFLPKH